MFRRFIRFIIIVINLVVIKGFIYDSDNAIVYKSPRDKSYFGYSVFLQKDSPNRIFIGAPKDGQNKEGNISSYNLNGALLETYSAPKNTQKTSIYKDMLFGAVISGGVEIGDSVLICAPKYTQVYKAEGKNLYLNNGACYELADFRKNIDDSGIYPNTGKDQFTNSKYNEAFGEAGFSAVYNKETDEFLLGSPGNLDWKGALIRIFRKTSQDLPPQSRQLESKHEFDFKHIHFKPDDKDGNIYIGYSVAVGKFWKSSTSFIVGAPRANNLKGEVLITDNNGYLIYTLECPDSEIGSYFGSSLCVLDVDGDGNNDLLVGAPTYGNSKHSNSGKVHIYINNGVGFDKPKQLAYRNSGAQFGSTMVNLGKISLDKYDAVAIASPFENNGNGAIHIYLGSHDGTLKLSQTIKMKGQTAFGFSLSPAVDVDGNNVVDLAVGAYASGHATILKGKPVFCFNVLVKTVDHLYSFTENAEFEVTYSISTNANYPVDAIIKIELDNRLQSKDYKSENRLTINSLTKSTFHAHTVKNLKDMNTPVQIRVSVDHQKCPICPVASPSCSNSTVKKIPFILECNHEPCTPALSVQTKFGVNELTVGEKDTFSMEITIRNEIDPAYLCSIDITKPDTISVKPESKQCEIGSSIRCKLENILKHQQIFKFELDAKQFNRIQNEIFFDINIACLNYTTSAEASLPLKYRQVLEVEGSSSDFIYINKNVTESGTTSFIYFVKNIISPIRNHPITLQIPKKLKSLNDVDIFYITKPIIESSSEDNPVNCEADLEFDTIADGGETELGESIINNANVGSVISCDEENIKCMTLRCSVNLNKNDYLKITIKIKPKILEIVKHYRSTFNVISTATYISEGQEMNTTSTINFQDAKIDTVNLFMYIIIGVIAGLALLGALVYVAYKFNFFKRPQHDKLMEEQNNPTEELHDLNKSQGE